VETPSRIARVPEDRTFNSVIQALKYAARGFKAFKNDRTQALFFCGRLDLRPQLPCH
jgi:hypothetical protein